MMKERMMQASNTANKLVKDVAMPIISVELVDDKCSFFAGEVVKGCIHVNLKQKIPETNIRIRFFGQERIRVSYDDKTTEIIDSSFILRNWVVGSPQIGMFTFPFSMKIPQWLPASMKFDVNKKMISSIEYSINASFEPCSEANSFYKFTGFVGK